MIKILGIECPDSFNELTLEKKSQILQVFLRNNFSKEAGKISLAEKQVALNGVLRRFYNRHNAVEHRLKKLTTEQESRYEMAYKQLIAQSHG